MLSVSKDVLARHTRRSLGNGGDPAIRKLQVSAVAQLRGMCGERNQCGAALVLPGREEDSLISGRIKDARETILAPVAALSRNRVNSLSRGLKADVLGDLRDQDKTAGLQAPKAGSARRGFDPR